jgi:hypothetical protein
MQENEPEYPESEMVQWLNTTFGQTLTVGNETIAPSIETPDKIFSFSNKELRLMYHMSRAQSEEEAAKKANVSITFAKKFFKSRQWQQFRDMALRVQAVRNGWTSARVVFELDRIYKGQLRINDTQFDALKELRSIIYPRGVGRDAGNPGGININIQMPELAPALQAKLKAIADESALPHAEAA